MAPRLGIDPFSKETEAALKTLTEYLQRTPKREQYEGARCGDLLLQAETALFRPEFPEDILRGDFTGMQHRTSMPPPINTQIILDLLLPPDKCEALVGDFEEIYRKKHRRVGKKGADLWYWKQVIITIWPLLRAARGGFVVNMVAFVLRMLGLGSLADQLKASSSAKASRERT